MTPRFEILYVCNGNNARSPLAAACTTKLVSTSPNGVTWQVDSAGTDTEPTDVIRPEAHQAAAVLELDLNGHDPRRLVPEECTKPDLILAMSWEQVSHIWSLVPEAYEKVFTMKEFVHWAKRAPGRPPILFADKIEQMRDKVAQAHAIRKRARADHGFWGGIRPQDMNLIEPVGMGDEAWAVLAQAVHALTSDIITLLTGPEPTEEPPAKRPARSRSKNRKKRTPAPRR